MTIAAWLAANRDIERLDAELIVANVLGSDRARIIAFPEQVLAPAQLQVLDTLGERLRDCEPLAYLLESKEFYGLSLNVDKRVLIPRPETELLVELTIEKIAPDAELLELGTGSGAIAIALKKTHTNLRITATDVSKSALCVARDNAQRHATDITFVESNWFSAVHGSFDCIVSNPPYIPNADPHLKALRHEPRRALMSGPDGLAAIRAITNHAGSFLRPGGILLVEHGCDQGQRVRELFAQNGLQAVETRQDLAGLDRVTAGTRVKDIHV